MLQAAELLTASVDGMLQALRNRADSKNELRLPVTTMTLASNNPLKFSPSGKVALDYLLAPSHEGFLPPARAMQDGFEDLSARHRAGHPGPHRPRRHRSQTGSNRPGTFLSYAAALARLRQTARGPA